MENKNKIKRVTLIAILISFALILSLIERMLPLQIIIPLPIPGIKLGLPNVITLFALFYLDVPSALAIIVIRTVLASTFMGSVTSFAFAFTGGMFAFVAMKLVLFFYPKFVSMIGVSIIGAAFHNFGQICAAMVIMETANVFGYLPILLITSVVSGFLIGIVFEAVVKKLKTVKSMQQYFDDAKIKTKRRTAGE